MGKVQVVPHNPIWRSLFAQEAHQLSTALGAMAKEIHHIGSTAIPDIYAKPIVDLLVIVEDISAVDTKSSEMILLGYEVMDEYGIVGRRYFRKANTNGVRTHHVHAFEIDAEPVKRHLLFRDYLIAHPEAAQQYSDLKRKLAKQYPIDSRAYTAGKDKFVIDIVLAAESWQKQQTVSDVDVLKQKQNEAI
ncbi:GrpB family protein [Leptothoe spongobia]|uniref:GrpB family protein n=1 Tax=Leptothoe spongobia TAU-MAC 1115 TaxID=1967444 RepID=A0A947DGL7_9CYAN|nr:GrpB family protein [Leptothoe spongobia]MBT9316203.1 GrpB family protein [Leptothoe spongobia TAU-MAC 1115]